MKTMKKVAALFVCQFLLFTSLAFADYDAVLEKLRKDTQHLKDLTGLIAHGYHTKRETLPCQQHVSKGAMGYHLRKDWKMDETFDPAEPEEAIVDTSGNLVAVEYVVYGDKTAVEMLKYFHITYSDGPGEGDVKATGAPSFENKGKGKYALHVWPWVKNPEGPFAGFNPEASCEEAKCRVIVQEDGSKKLEGECSQLSK